MAKGFAPLTPSPPVKYFLKTLHLHCENMIISSSHDQNQKEDEMFSLREQWEDGKGKVEKVGVF